MESFANTYLVNLKSGFFVSLIAMPLCLGIASASACPPIAGVITAIIGGMIVSLIGGSKLSIKGPAAGLIVVVLGAVMDLSFGDLSLGYRRMLAVAMVASLMQAIFALGKATRFLKNIPPSVIHGMLFGIGIIILAKQIHVLLGTKPSGKTPIELITEIPQSLLAVNPELAFIGVLTLFLMAFIPVFPNKTIRSIPPALIALVFVVPLSIFWHLDQKGDYSFLSHIYAVGPEFLVDLPSSLLNSLAFPDFSILSEPVAYKYVLMFALVGSVESVLTVMAIDSMAKTKSDLDKDLLGLSMGNFICALIGGLPMISEVVRSKANIDNGATSRLSGFFHGLFLLLFVSLLAPIVKHIPLATLAAMLILTGYRLASPAQFKHTLSTGKDNLAVFAITLITTVTIDLLLAILLGCGLKALLQAVQRKRPLP